MTETGFPIESGMTAKINNTILDCLPALVGLRFPPQGHFFFDESNNVARKDTQEKRNVTLYNISLISQHSYKTLLFLSIHVIMYIEVFST